MSRVFVVQQPLKRTPEGQWRPLFDISPARKFGEIRFLLMRPGNIYSSNWPAVLDRMQDTLHNFSDDDYLLPAGEPALIAAAAMIAGQANEGRVKILKWDRFAHAYSVVQLETR